MLRFYPMKTSTPFSFVFKATVFGLAVAFIVLLLRPDLLGRGRPEVKINEVNETQRFNLTTAPPTGQVSYSSAVDIAAPAVVNIYSTKVVTERANPLFEDPFFRYFFGDSLAPRKRI